MYYTQSSLPACTSTRQCQIAEYPTSYGPRKGRCYNGQWKYEDELPPGACGINTGCDAQLGQCNPDSATFTDCVKNCNGANYYCGKIGNGNPQWVKEGVETCIGTSLVCSETTAISCGKTLKCYPSGWKDINNPPAGECQTCAQIGNSCTFSDSCSGQACGSQTIYCAVVDGRRQWTATKPSECEVSCSDECAGDSCFGSFKHVCGEDDEDSCLEWAETERCPNGCADDGINCNEISAPSCPAVGETCDASSECTKDCDGQKYYCIDDQWAINQPPCDASNNCQDMEVCGVTYKCYASQGFWRYTDNNPAHIAERCEGKQCGNDDCGVSCGTCSSGTCQDGQCVSASSCTNECDPSRPECYDGSHEESCTLDTDECYKKSEGSFCYSGCDSGICNPDNPFL